MKSIYLDYASITPIDPQVRKEMDKWNREPLNPSSIHSLGVKAKKALDQSRKNIADFLNAHADEIIFTSGGTEANALAIEGTCRAAYRAFQKAGEKNPKLHIIISAIEHSSIIEAADMLEKQGVEVTRLVVDKNGLVSLEQFKKAIKPETFLVSIMMANNEIGTIEPIREIAKVIRDYRKVQGKKKKYNSNCNWNCNSQSPIFPYPLFHTDACQAVLYEELNIEKLGVDLLTLDASKAYGPRGVGALFVKRGTHTEPIIYGGGQENGLRSGTENIPSIVGFAAAIQLAQKNMTKEKQRILSWRDYFEKQVKKIQPDAIINADTFSEALDNCNCNSNYNSKRIAHISNITFPNIDAEMLALRLDAKGVAVSTKSACLRDEDESYVLRAIGANSKSSVRFSFGKWTRKSDLDKVLNLLKKFTQDRPEYAE